MRERDGDTLEIAEALLQKLSCEEGKKFRTLSRPAALAIAGYEWPGNVRQLENALRSAIVLNDGEELTFEMLPEAVRNSAETDKDKDMSAEGVVTPLRTAHRTPYEGPSETSQVDPYGGVKPLWQVEKEAIEAAIETCGGNIPKAAALLEVSPSTIYRKRSVWLDRGLAS